MNYTLARNVIIYDELDKILSVFTTSDIKVIVLAGAALGVMVYPNIGERPMGDIDLLIRHSDKQKIGALLENLGYVLDTARSDEAHYSKTLDTFTLHIDCHTDLRHYLDDRALQGVWNRAINKSPLIRGDLGVCNCLILSPEDSLIYTAVDSAIYHGRITDNTINDIELIIKHYGNSLNEPSPLVGEGRVRGVSGLDWHLVIRRNKSYRLETPLYILFDLCRHKGEPRLRAGRQEGVLIPDGVMDSLKPRKRSLEYRLYKVILNSALRTPHSELYEDASRIALFLFRPAARWEIFRNSFFPSLRFVKQQYEQTLYPVSYILYPIRVFSLLDRIRKGLYQILQGAVNL